MSEKQLCPSCQAVLRPNARFCEECGTAVAASAATEQAVAPKKRDWRPWAAIGATLLLCAAVYLPPMLFPDYRDARANSQNTTTRPVTLYAVGNVMRRQNSGSGPIRTMLRRGDAVTGMVIEEGGKTWLQVDDNGDYVSTGWLMDTAPPGLAQQYADYDWDITATVDVRAGDSGFSEVVTQLEPGTAIKILGLTDSGYVEIKVDEQTIGYIDADDLGFDADSAESRSVGAQGRDLISRMTITSGEETTLAGMIGGQQVELRFTLADDEETLVGFSRYTKGKNAELCDFNLYFAGANAKGGLIFDQRPIAIEDTASATACGAWPMIVLSRPDTPDGAYTAQWLLGEKTQMAGTLVGKSIK